VESCQNYAFADQVRRSAISVPSNIAEGMTRDSEVEKNRFLSIAKASNAELETQLLIAKKLGHFSNDVCEELLKQVQKVNFQLYYVTAPRPAGRGFQLLRQQPARGRIYASLHWQEPTVLRLLV